MATVGSIQSLSGKFFAQDANGNIRELQVGDQITQGERVFGDDSNIDTDKIEILSQDGGLLSFLGNQSHILDFSSVDSTFGNEEVAFKEESVWNAMDDESAIELAEGEETAAGDESILEEETAAGDEGPTSSDSGVFSFNSRDGGSVDVGSSLRSDSFASGDDIEINEDFVNSAPVVFNVDVTQNEVLDGYNIISGQLSVTDADANDTHTFFAVAGSLSVTTPDGVEMNDVTFVFNPDGSYTISGDFNALAFGENAIVSFQYYAVDNVGNSSQIATLALTVVGTNDQPVVSDINANGEGGGEGFIGLDKLETTGTYEEGYLPSYRTWGQTFVAESDSLAKIDFNINDSYDNGIDSEVRVVIVSTDSFINDPATAWHPTTFGGNVVFEQNISLSFGSNNIVTVDTSGLNLAVGQQYQVILYHIGGDPFNIYYSASGNVDDGIALTEISNTGTGSGYIHGGYNMGITLTYGDGQTIVYESAGEIGTTDSDIYTTFEGNLATAQDDDTTDTHTYHLVNDTLAVNSSNIDPTLIEGLNVVVNEDGSYSITGDFNALATGETATVTFQYVADDGQGFDGTDGIHESSISEPATVTLTITGTNDQPVVSDINANGIDTAEVVTEEFSAFGPTSEITVQVNGIDVTTSNQNGYYYSNSHNGMYGVSGYALEINHATADAVVTFPYEVESFSFRAGAVNGNNENIRVLYTDGTSEIIHIADNVNSSSNYDGYQYTTLISATAPTGKMISGFVILDGTDYWLLDGITFNGISETVVYETHDATDIAGVNDTQEDVYTTFEGNLATVQDDDITDTHTYHLVNDTLAVNSSNIDPTLIEGLNVVVNEDGSYSITGDFNALAAGETATVTFQYVADDGQGFDGTDGIHESSISEPATVTLTITGTNDQPVVSDITVNNSYSNSYVDDGIINNIGGNNTLASALNLDGSFVLGQNADVSNSETVPYVSINGIGDGTTDWYQFTVTNAGDTAVFDVDYGMNQGGSFDSWLNLYDANGTLLASNDDSSASNGDGGSIHSYDAFLNYTFQNPGVFYIQVGRYSGGAPIPVGGTYTLQVSLENAIMSDSGVINEALNGLNTFEGSLATVQDDDVNDEHTYILSGDASVDNQLVSNLGVVINPNGTYTVTGDFNALAAGETATVTFQYVADDGQGFDGTDGIHESSISEPATVTLTITGTNDQPVVSDVVVSQAEVLDGINTFVGTLVASDDDVNDDHTYSLSGDASVDNQLVSNLGVVINSDGTYTVTGDFNALAAGETATVTFQYVADDGQGFDGTDGIHESSISEPATVTLTITGTNDQPVVSDFTVVVNEASLDDTRRYEDYRYEGQLTAQDDDVNDTHTFGIVNGSYSVSITTGESTYNLPSWAVNLLVLTNQLSINLNADTGEYAVSSTLFNTLGVNQSMSVSFDYRANDGKGFSGDSENESSISEIATATLVVEGTNDQPVAYSNSYAQWEQLLLNTPAKDSLFKGNLPLAHDEDVLDNLNIKYFGIDENSDGNIDATTTGPISSSGEPVVDPEQTLVIVNQNGTFSVVNPTFNALAAGETATVTFQYYVDDMSGAVAGDNPHESPQSEVQTITLTIIGTNDRPVVANISDTQHEADSGVNTFNGTLVAQDEDTNDTHTFSIKSGSIVSDIAGVSVVLNSGSGEYTVTGDFNSLAAGEIAEVSFQYRANDGSGAPNWDESKYSNWKTATFTVIGTNDAPVAVDDTITVEEDIPFTSNISLLANDYDIDGDNISAVAGTFETLQGGTIVITEDGHYTYTPPTNYSGSDSVVYTVTDGDLTDTGVLSINVTPISDAPNLVMSISNKEEILGDNLVVNGSFEDISGIDRYGNPVLDDYDIPNGGLVYRIEIPGWKLDTMTTDKYFYNGASSFVDGKPSTSAASTLFKTQDGFYGIDGNSNNDSQGIDKNETLLFDLKISTTSAIFELKDALDIKWTAYDSLGNEIDSGNVQGQNSIDISLNQEFQYVEFTNNITGGGNVDNGFYVKPSGEFSDMPAMEPHHYNHAGVGSTDGDNYMDLGASPGNTSIYQTFETLEAGKTYKLTVDFRDKAAMQEQGQSGRDSGVMQVLWNGVIVATILGDNIEAWNTLELDLVAQSGTNKLTFREIGESDDNWGMAIDNVQLVEVIGFSYDLNINATLTDESESLTPVTLLGSTLPSDASLFIGGELLEADDNGNYIIEVESGVSVVVNLQTSTELNLEEINSIEGSVTSQEVIDSVVVDEVTTTSTAFNEVDINLDGSATGTDGDDLFKIAGDDYDIDGGDGDDMLQLVSGYSIDFSGLSTFKNIEQIDLSATGSNVLNNLSANDVLEMTDDGNEIVITGTSEDSVNLRGNWSVSSSGVEGFKSYTSTADGDETVTLHIQDDIDVNTI
jgi:large repetitive protein